MHSEGLNIKIIMECLIFSGYIETIDLASSDRSTPILRKEEYDILDKYLPELDEIKPKKTENTAGSSSRRTARQAAILEKQSPSRLLRRVVVKKKLVKGTETTEEIMNRFLPDVCITKLSSQQAKDLSRPWGFLDASKVEDKYTFRATILQKRNSEVLVAWTPPGILENEWMKSSELPPNNVKIVDVQNLSWRQKLLAGGHIRITQ